MNLHVVTPTQARLAQERREREARIAAAARNPLQKEEPPRKIIIVTDEGKREAERQRIMAEKAERERIWREIKAARAKERWRASWRYMVQLSDEKRREDAVISMRQILEQTSKKYGVSIADMKSARRTRGALLQSRFEFCWRCKRETPNSFPAIGRFLGGRDHTTAIHAVRKYDAMRHEVITGERAYSKKTRNAAFLPDLIITGE